MPDLTSLIARAEALLARLEAVLPHPPSAPDWSASIAFRYRRRGTSGVIEPVRHVATIRLADIVDTISDTRRAARERHGWIMDTYLIRRPAAEAEEGAA